MSEEYGLIYERLMNGEVGPKIDNDICRAIGVNVWFDAPSESLEGALQVAGQALPGWNWRIASCSVSDDAWVTPDFNHPEHGEGFKQRFPIQALQDPVEFFGTDVGKRPSGNPAAALCASVMLALLMLADLEQPPSEA